MRMSVENGIVAFIVLVVVVVVELVIEGLEDEDRFAEDEDDYDIAAFTNNSIFSASRTLYFGFSNCLGWEGSGFRVQVDKSILCSCVFGSELNPEPRTLVPEL